MSYSFCKC